MIVLDVAELEVLVRQLLAVAVVVVVQRQLLVVAVAEQGRKQLLQVVHLVAGMVSLDIKRIPLVYVDIVGILLQVLVKISL